MSTTRAGRDKTLHTLFEAAVTIKFLDGIVEVISAALLFLLNPAWLQRVVSSLLAPELAEDPTDWLAHALLNAVHALSIDQRLFVAIYLFVHGIIKAGLVVALWTRRLWAYPIGGAILGVLAIYQVLLYVRSYAPLQLFLLVIDLIVLVLLRYEYLRLKTLR